MKLRADLESNKLFKDLELPIGGIKICLFFGSAGESPQEIVEPFELRVTFFPHQFAPLEPIVIVII